MSMALLDKLVCNLSELYYHSNPETKQVFAPAHAPDMLYHLFWTFLFIDQDVRHPSLRPKVTCNYFIRLLQKEGAYPREYFDKRVLQRIYNDIVSRPLLPAPHLILALQDVDRAITAESQETADLNVGSERRSTNHRQLSFFKNLLNPIKMETFKKIRQWFLKSIREENSQGRVIWNSQDSLIMPHVENLQGDPIQTDSSDDLTSTSPSPSPSARISLYGPCQLSQSRSSTFPRKSPGLHRSINLNKSAATLERKTNGIAPACSILRHGFTTVAPGWHLEGDGLDHIVRFPKLKNPE
ncbi:hypothetical protein BGZ51_003733 [Haplosporangium sp. Z 767]|nr:hypothetical protein BGZ51_003733 [Haplosporangium sp. Z 767]KAF9193857.1 hypothetical protein BGZ50_006911 [Haplosporangium sp. Z 11]